MSKWFVYIAVDKNDLYTGICNDIVSEEILLSQELNCENIKISWYQEFENKIDCLKKLKEINKLDDSEKLMFLEEFRKIIVIKDDNYKEEYLKFPLVYNLKQTLQISDFFKHMPEIWKLDDLYIENVSEYLSIKKTQIAYVKLWNISVDYSTNVGLVTKEKFFPILKY